MQLEDLHNYETQISDLSPLAGMPLKHLDCRDTPVADLTPLAKCTKLTKLLVKNTKVNAAAIAILQTSLPNCQIESDDAAPK